MKKVFLSPDEGQWKVKTVGTRKAAGLYDTKAKALTKAIEVAKNKKAELFVQKENGKIQFRNSYGSDPFPPKG